VKRYVLLILRIAVAVAGIGYILYSITWTDTAADGAVKPGMLTVLRGAEHLWLAGGLLLVALLPPGQALRWWLLMRCRGLLVTYPRALQLTMLGLFFNLCMPGMTGGDLVRAWYAARGTDQRGAAIMSIVFDRVTGLFGLFLLAAIVGLTRLDHELVRMVTLAAWTILAGLGVGAMVYFSPKVRRATGLHHLLVKLDERNFIRRIDAAAVAYHRHLPTLAVAVVVSMGVQTAQIVATALAGYALGIEAPLTLLLVVLPVLMAAGSMPLTYQGLGVMEALGHVMLVQQGYATNNQVVAMLMVMRLYLIFYGLLGSCVLLRRDVSLHAPADLPRG